MCAHRRSPAQAGTSHPLSESVAGFPHRRWDVGTGVAPLRHASEGWHPEWATAHTVGRARMREPLAQCSQSEAVPALLQMTLTRSCRLGIGSRPIFIRPMPAVIRQASAHSPRAVIAVRTRSLMDDCPFRRIVFKNVVTQRPDLPILSGVHDCIGRPCQPKPFLDTALSRIAYAATGRWCKGRLSFLQL